MKLNYEPPDDATSARMRLVRRRDTPCEIRLRRALHAKGLRYRVDRQVVSERRTRADIVFTARRVAIFIDGCFWHGCPIHAKMPKRNAAWWLDKMSYNRRRDEQADAALRACGWTVVRVWEHDDPIEAAGQIAALIWLPVYARRKDSYRPATEKQKCRSR